MSKGPASTDKSLLSALNELAAAWRLDFRTEMARRGFPWHLTASGDLLPHLGDEGLPQTALVQSMGISKQAVQQLLDHLESSGVVRRETDPADKRAKRVLLTDLGRRDLKERQEVLIEIEERAREQLGKKRFVRLEKAVKRLRKSG